MLSLSKGSQRCSPPSKLKSLPNGWWEVTKRQGQVHGSPDRPKAVLLPRLLSSLANRRVGQLEHAPGTSDFQLVLEAIVCVPGGENKKIRVLVDSGAQINIIRDGIFESTDYKVSKNPAQLFAIDGSNVQGGNLEASLRLTFGCESGGRLQPLRL